MADYTLWTGFFDAWKATSDWIKALAILAPPGFALGALALLLRHRAATAPGGVAAPVAPEALQGETRLPDEIDRFITGEEDNLHDRQQAARQALLPAPPDPESAEIIEDIRRIILDNYRADHAPEAALRHVRRYLADRAARPDRD